MIAYAPSVVVYPATQASMVVQCPRHFRALRGGVHGRHLLVLDKSRLNRSGYHGFYIQVQNTGHKPEKARAYALCSR